MEGSTEVEDFTRVVNEMTSSVSSVREVIRTMLEKFVIHIMNIHCSLNLFIFNFRHKSDPEGSNHKDGISLLSLKNHVLMDYLHSLVLLSSQRILGHSLLDRTPPSESFASSSRGPRGSDAGDLVDSLVESRAVLEKVKTLETRMRYQIDKLVRIAREAPNAQSKDVIDGQIFLHPVAFHLLNCLLF